jgi:RHS repeat-associated protein
MQDIVAAGTSVLSASVSQHGTVQLGYHLNGNLKKKSDFSQNADDAYKYLNSPHAVTRVNLAGGQMYCYQYDGAGNLTHHDFRPTVGESCSQYQRRFFYDIAHRPERIQSGQAFGYQILRFRYDATGERYVQRQYGNSLPTQDYLVTLYPFPGYEVELVRAGSNFSIQSGRQRLGSWGLWRASALQPQGERVWWHGDRLGSPLAKSKANGQAAERHGFDAWGAGREGNGTPRPEGRLGSTLSPRGFTGHEHLDVVGGLIHMNGRAYDPNLGRFLSVDPIVQFPANSQSLNPYSYLMNNPLSGIDPTGYVGCGDVNIKGGTSGTCTHALEDGSEVEVGYRVSKDGNKATFAATRSTFNAIAADNGARLAQQSFGMKREAGGSRENAPAVDVPNESPLSTRGPGEVDSPTGPLPGQIRREVTIPAYVPLDTMAHRSIANINLTLAIYGLAVYASGDTEAISDYETANLLFDPPMLRVLDQADGRVAAARASEHRNTMWFGTERYSQSIGNQQFNYHNMRTGWIPRIMAQTITTVHEFGHLHSQYSFSSLGPGATPGAIENAANDFVRIKIPYLSPHVRLDYVTR